MNRNFVGSILEDLPRMLPIKFQFIWLSGYRGEDSLEINQSETRIAKVAHLVPIR
jgi:hypothetical protein